jgi:hypothetical protein
MEHEIEVLRKDFEIHLENMLIITHLQQENTFI